jgi:hypothetical protein
VSRTIRAASQNYNNTGKKLMLGRNLLETTAKYNIGMLTQVIAMANSVQACPEKTLLKGSIA